MTRVRTGIEVLDKKLDGGFAAPSSLLFFSQVMAEKRIFAEHFAITGVKDGERCLYVDFYRAPQLARREFRKFGQYPEERLFMVDATSTQILLPSTERFRITNVDDLEHIRSVVESAMLEVRPSRVILDSLEYITDRFPKEEVLRFLSSIIETARRVECVVAILFMNWTYNKEDLETLLDLSDYMVEFQTSMKGGIILNALKIEENRDDGIKTNWIPFTFKDMMGLVIYFPKILVTGPHSAGKSTFVRAVSISSISIDRLGTTVAFDYGNVELSGIEAELFGTPGQERFEFIFKIFAREVNGIMLVVDSTRPETFDRAMQMRGLAGEALPCVIAANKSDLPGALTPNEIRAVMQLPSNVPVVETVATTGRGVKDALQALAELIIWR